MPYFFFYFSLLPFLLSSLPSLSLPPSLSHLSLSNLGDKVSAGDDIFSMETDKAVVKDSATQDGYIAKLLVRRQGDGRWER